MVNQYLGPFGSGMCCFFGLERGGGDVLFFDFFRFPCGKMSVGKWMLVLVIWRALALKLCDSQVLRCETPRFIYTVYK